MLDFRITVGRLIYSAIFVDICENNLLSMQDKNITVAVLDFGSNAIKLALAEKKIRGEGENAVTLEDFIKVIYYDYEPSEGAILRGVIRNLSDTANKVQRLITRAEEATGVSIRSLYVLVDGQGLQSKLYSANLEFSEPQEIKNSDLEELLKLVTPEPNKFNFENPYARFYVGGTYAERPVGVKGLNLRGEFQFFQTEQYVIENIYDVLESKLDLEVISFWVAPALLGEKFLTDEQMRIGSAIIDFGAETTSIAIYKNGFLEGLRVLPIGSQQITNDLTYLQISPQEAERLKISEGTVLLDLKENDPIQVFSADMHTKKEVTRYRVNQYIEARMREIVDNVKRIIEQFVGAEKLNGGIIITGGGALIKGLQTYLIEMLGTSVEHASFFVSGDSRNIEFLSKYGTLSLYSMLIRGTVSCTEFTEIPIEEESTEAVVTDIVPESDSSAGLPNPKQESLFVDDDFPDAPLDPESSEINGYQKEDVFSSEDVKSSNTQPQEKRRKSSRTRKKKNGFWDTLKGLLPFDDFDEMDSDDETV